MGQNRVNSIQSGAAVGAFWKFIPVVALATGALYKETDFKIESALECVYFS